MERILFVVHRIPFPPNKGDKIRSFNELKFLSRHCSIDLLCLADDPADLKYETDLQTFCAQVKVFPLDKKNAKIRGGFSLLTGNALSSRYFYLKEMQSVFDQWVQGREYSAVLCFSSSMAEYIFCSETLKKLNPDKSPKLVMDFCDVDSDKWRQYAESSAFPLNLLYRLEHKRLMDYEKRIQGAFHHTVLVSKGEEELFRAICPDCTNLSVIANGVDHSFFAPSPKQAEFAIEIQAPVIVFTGAMDYSVNVEGVHWFVRNVLPQLKQRYPTLKFYIVGSNPVAEVRELADDLTVFVTGFVDDIRDYYTLADVCVAPLHLGRGVQNKVLEAMAMERPVVSTSKANAGVQGETGVHLLIADSAEDFADAVSSLLDDPKQAALFGRAAREFVVSQFDWDANMMQLQKLLLCNFGETSSN